MQAYDARAPRANTNLRTWIVLLFVMLVFLPIHQITLWISPTLTTKSATVREALILATAAALLIYIRRVEGLSLRSVGLGTSVWWKSIAWGVVTALLCAAAGGAVAFVTKFNGGATARELEKLPLWLVVVIVCRAGFVEELFFRGFAIERLSGMGWPRYAAALFPLTIFALLHLYNGAANVLLAFVLGAILAAFYLWRRDLVANILAHFLVDFVTVVAPRLVSSAHH